MQGATATVSLRQPRTEAHLSQLAVLENFAEHGLYVKFSNEEAEELEREALALALEESTQEVGSDRGQSGLSPVPFSREEADEVAAQLMEVAPPNVPSNGRRLQQEPRRQAPPLKSTRSGSFKGLFGFNRDKSKKGKAAESAAARQQQQSSQPAPQSQPSKPQVAAPPAKSSLASPTSPKKAPKSASSPRKVAFQAPAQDESQNGFSGNSYDSALVDARALRAELEGGLKQYRARNDSLIKQMNMLHARLQRRNPTVQAVEELKQAQIQVETAEVQLDVIEEGIDELCSLESYMQRTHPPEESACLLAHEVVRQLLACLSHVGVRSKVLQATPLQGQQATKPDQRAERLVSHFRKESRAESPKPLPSLPDIPEEAPDSDDSQDLQEEDTQVPATEPQTPPKQSVNKAFPSESPDRSRHGVSIVEAHPLPARHTFAHAQESAEQPTGTVTIVDAQPLPARHITPPTSSRGGPHVPEQSAHSVGIAEAHPLPARRDVPAAPDSGADKARDSQDTSSALRAHALADISSPAGSMPEGTTQSALQAHAPSAHDHQHSSEASGLEDSSPEASVAGRSSSGRKKFDSEDLSGATSFASAAHDTPDAEEEPYHDFWGGRAEPAQACVESPQDAKLMHGDKHKEMEKQISAVLPGQYRDETGAQHEQHSPEHVPAQAIVQHEDSSMPEDTRSETLTEQTEREEAEKKHAEQEQSEREQTERDPAERKQAGHANESQHERDAEVGQPQVPDLNSTDLLGSRALGPLGLALKDSGELLAQPVTASQPELKQVPAQHHAPESMQRADSDAGHKKKKRSGFGLLFKRKGSPVNGIQEASIPAAVKPEAEPLAEGSRSAQPAQEPEGPAQVRPEEDAVDRAAAAQLRLAAQSTSQSTADETPAALETSSSGVVDAAVAKQSSISAKLAGASAPILDQGAAAAAEADRASSADSATGNHANAGSASSPEAASSSGELTKQRSAGGTPSRSSAVRSRVRSAGARQRRGGASADGSPRTAAAPQELRQNAEVDTLFQELDQIIPNNFMSQTFEDSSAGLVSATPPSSNLTPAQRELAELDAEKHAGLVKSVAKDISDYQAPDMPSLVEFVRDTSARLGVIMTDEAAVLSQFPTWPQAKWNALRDAADAYSELSDFARREKQWLLQRGTCEEEVQRMEAFLDTVMTRTQGLAAREGAHAAEWRQHCIPWDACIHRSVRVNSLHLATLYMSRVLFEVASLERSEDTVQEACLRHLAASVRATHKIYHFAGGFDAELSALFDKVRRLAKYYVRVLAPPR